MNREAANKLYELLPTVYRLRDAENGQPLKALLAVLAEQAEMLERDITQLNENWFIETCEEWVVPYIADLLGVEGVQPLPSANFTLRAYVANTLRFRRRKGTAAVLEELTRTTTGWTARAVESFQLLAVTQYLNHVRAEHPGTASLRDTDGLELLGGPFERAPRSAEVRRIASGRGKYNIPHVSLYLYRLQSYPIARSTAHKVASRRYTFSPLGNSTPLFNRPQTETEITHLAEEINVPGRLRRRPLYAELEQRRAGNIPPHSYFGRNPVFEVFLDGQSNPLEPESILICNLDGWEKAGWSPPPKKNGEKIAVDPVRGRLALLEGPSAKTVGVGYSYGFSGDIGGGPYNRQEDALREFSQRVTWQVGVSKKIQAVGSESIFEKLGEAIDEWNKQDPGTVGFISVLDNCTYEEDLPEIKIPEGSQLLIVAAHWPVVEDPASDGQYVPDDLRPHVQGNIAVRGMAAEASNNPGKLVLNGLLLGGALTLLKGNLGSLQLVHSTLVPGRGFDAKGNPKQPGKPSISVDASNGRLQLKIEKSITGFLRLPVEVAGLSVQDSILSAPPDDPAIAANADGSRPGPPTTLERTTIFGKVRVKELNLASEVIFTGPVVVERHQTGCVRFSYVPDGSHTPRRHRCQPDLALRREAEARGLESMDELSDTEAGLVRARVTPQFTSRRYGEPGFAQLSFACAVEIRTGAEDGSEMGAFSSLKQPQREANLRASLREYLPVGLEAGLFFVT